MSQSLSIHDVEIKVNSAGMFCLNDLHKAAGGEKRYQPSNWLSLSQTDELIKEIELTPEITGVKKEPGRYGGTFVCKELVYAYAMWISPRFHLHVIRVFDQTERVTTELDSLVTNVRSQSKALSKQINKAGATVKELKQHGSSWGVYGAAIRKAKRECNKEINDLKEQVQLMLDF